MYVCVYYYEKNDGIWNWTFFIIMLITSYAILLIGYEHCKGIKSCNNTTQEMYTVVHEQENANKKKRIPSLEFMYKIL